MAYVKKTWVENIDSDWFKLVLKECGSSFRKLGKDTNPKGLHCNLTDRTLRRNIIEKKRIREDHLRTIAEILNVDFDYLKGKYAWTIHVFDDDRVTTLIMKKYFPPELHPFTERQARIEMAEYYHFFYELYARYGLTSEDRKKLAENNFRYEDLDKAIARYLDKALYGNTYRNEAKKRFDKIENEAQHQSQGGARAFREKFEKQLAVYEYLNQHRVHPLMDSMYLNEEPQNERDLIELMLEDLIGLGIISPMEELAVDYCNLDFTLD